MTDAERLMQETQTIQDRLNRFLACRTETEAKTWLVYEGVIHPVTKQAWMSWWAVNKETRYVS